MPGATYDAQNPSAHGLRLHHVQLAVPVGSEDECRAYWVEALGFIELQKPPELAVRGGLWIRMDQLEIHIGGEDPQTPANKAHPAIVMTDLEGFAKRFEAAGIPIQWDENFPGYQRFYAKDPGGNRLEFMEPLEGVPALW